MTSTREALQRIATGRRVTKHQLAELERDGHITVADDGAISITESGTTILTERN